MTIKTKLTGLILACLLPLATGCTDTSMLYQGAPVTSVPIVTLQEGVPVAGRWETFDLVIDYTYKKNNDKLEIAGQARLGDHYRENYEGISRMQTYLFFLDQDARVLETAFFVTPWSGSNEDIQEFSKFYTVPASTKGISFGYSGAVNGMDGSASFYELPLSK